jgi:hypothetical protein
LTQAATGAVHVTFTGVITQSLGALAQSAVGGLTFSPIDNPTGPASQRLTGLRQMSWAAVIVPPRATVGQRLARMTQSSVGAVRRNPAGAIAQRLRGLGQRF